MVAPFPRNANLRQCTIHETHERLEPQGEGDPEFTVAVSRPLAPDQVLYVGLNEPSSYEQAFIESKGLAHVGPEALPDTTKPVLDWLKGTGTIYVAVHFVLDVLAPAHHDYLLR